MIGTLLKGFVLLHLQWYVFHASMSRYYCVVSVKPCMHVSDLLKPLWEACLLPIAYCLSVYDVRGTTNESEIELLWRATCILSSKVLWGCSHYLKGDLLPSVERSRLTGTHTCIFYAKLDEPWAQYTFYYRLHAFHTSALKELTEPLESHNQLTTSIQNVQIMSV